MHIGLGPGRDLLEAPYAGRVQRALKGGADTLNTPEVIDRALGSLLRLRERSVYRRQFVRALGKLAPQLSQLVIPLPQLQPQPITLGSQPRPFPLSLQ